MKRKRKEKREGTVREKVKVKKRNDSVLTDEEEDSIASRNKRRRKHNTTRLKTQNIDRPTAR